MINLYKEAKQIAQEAINECGTDEDACLEYIEQTCDGHRVSIYYGEGIAFCAEQDTSPGEYWLDECGGLAHEGDTFGSIACRVAYATLYCKSMDALYELLGQEE